MKPYQTRVVEEKQELDSKISKLQTFIEGEQFNTVPQDEQSRMSKQLSVMQEYSAVLGDRIAAFTD